MRIIRLNVFLLQRYEFILILMKSILYFRFEIM